MIMIKLRFDNPAKNNDLIINPDAIDYVQLQPETKKIVFHFDKDYRILLDTQYIDDLKELHLDNKSFLLTEEIIDFIAGCRLDDGTRSHS